MSEYSSLPLPQLFMAPYWDCVMCENERFWRMSRYLDRGHGPWHWNDKSTQRIILWDKESQEFPFCVINVSWGKRHSVQTFAEDFPEVANSMLNRASGLIVEALEEAAASYGKSVATHPVKVRLVVLDWRQGNHWEVLNWIISCLKVALGCLLITGLASVGLLRCYHQLTWHLLFCPSEKIQTANFIWWST